MASDGRDRHARARRWLRLLGAPLLILALAVGLRTWRLDHGLPEVQSVDAFKFLEPAARIADTGDTRPTDFQYPAVSHLLFAAAYRAFDGIAPGQRVLITRAVVALFGAALPLVVWAVARRLAGDGAAVIAGGLQALSVVSLSYSRVVHVDTIVSLFAFAAVAVAYAADGRMRWFAAAGLLTGLAAGTKYNGGWALAIVALFAFTDVGRGGRAGRIAARVVMASLVAALTFLLTSPWMLPLRAEYLERFRLEAAIQRYGHIGRIHHGWLDYLISASPTWEMPWLGTSILTTLGPVVLVLVLLGLGAGLSGRLGLAGFGLAAYVAIYTVLISGPGHLKAIRFLMPVLPAAYVLAAAVAARAAASIRHARAALAIAAVVVLAVPAWTSLGFLRLHRGETSNDIARRWVSRNLPPGSRVLLGPFFTDDLYRLPLTIGVLPQVGSRSYRLPEGIGASPERTPIYHSQLVGQLRAAGYEWVILNSYFDGAFAPIPENLRWFPRSVEEYRAFRAELMRSADLALAVPGLGAGRQGPDIWIWRLRADGSAGGR